jgi:8-oxo-dGTP pyrophosphatase MutT (NUDIX family)
VLIFQGDRVGREGRLSVGCAAAIFDQTQERLLLTRRTDNARWCLPGGRMESGECAAECCAREVLEETGLEVEVLIGSLRMRTATAISWYPSASRPM